MASLIGMLEAIEISPEDWKSVCAKIGFRNVFAEEPFIDIYSEVYEVKPKYFIVKSSDKVFSALFTFSKGKDLIFTTHYMFTAIWINQNEGEILRNQALEVLLTFLKTKYRNIALRLPVGFFDLRPFYWEGFKSTHKYTYVKDLNDLSYHHNIRRILSKGSEAYDFKVDEWSGGVEHLIKKDLSSLRFPSTFIDKVLTAYKMLWKEGKMLVLSGYSGTELIGCQVIMIDAVQKTAYLFFISKVEGHYKTGFPAFLYDFVFSHLKTLNYQTVDLFGANYASIARFKSKLNPELHQFFEMRYNRKEAVMYKMKERLKSGCKRLIGR